MKIILQNKNKSQLQTRLDQEKAPCERHCEAVETHAHHGQPCANRQSLFKEPRQANENHFQVDLLGEWIRP